MVVKRIAFACVYTLLYIIGAKAADQLTFGQLRSERSHSLSATCSEVYRGTLGETARRLLSKETDSWQGGTLQFEMDVDGTAQNYFTLRLSGDEADDCIVMLFIDSLQVGYRHLGDYDLLHRGNSQAPCPGKFYYVTIPLPRRHTDGRKHVKLELRAYGNTWDYGDTFERYQQPMKAGTIGFYQAYTHKEKFFLPPKGECQGSNLQPTATVRTSPDAELLEELKQRLNRRIGGLVQRQGGLGQQDVWLLADAYGVEWTPAYRNPVVVSKVVTAVDAFCDRFEAQPDIVYKDGSVYNCDWMTTALLARSIRSLWPTLQDSLKNNTERQRRWVSLLKASVEYGVTHRRQYTNQSMIIDMAAYENNRALMLLAPQEARPEYLLLQYLYESLGMAPWSGPLQADGTQRWPLGHDYWQLTALGLTKELGYVGYYGEVADWVCHIYRATCLPGVPHSGDAKIRQQLLRIAQARYPFRYPALDNNGHRCFRAETLVGWRDGNHYPGDVMYGDRGTAWDSNPIMTASLTADPQAVAIARQSVADGQIWNIAATKMKEIGNPRVAQSLLHLPDDYAMLMAQPENKDKSLLLPMSDEMPDFLFADEEDGVVALKHGQERLYVSLYWRARMGVNRLCKVHYMTPAMERVANVFADDVQFTPSGMTYTRPDRNNMEFVHYREFYPDIHSAHAGEQLPIAQIPEGIAFKPGQENAYAGKADFYRLCYGPYIICMNSSATLEAKTEVPRGCLLFHDGQWTTTEEGPVTIAPRTTCVYYQAKP